MATSDEPMPGLSPAGAAPELTEAGFAVEIADAPLLHVGFNLADFAHVVVLHEVGVLSLDAAGSFAVFFFDVSA